MNGESISPTRRSINLAFQHLKTGNLGEAEQLGRQALQADPNDPEALHLLGSIAIGTAKYSSAAELIGKALTIRPDHADACFDYGVALRGLGRREQARESFLKAVNLNPNSADAHLNLGSSLQEIGRWTEAATAFQKAITIKPAYLKAHYNLGMVMQTCGEMDRAAACYQEVLAIMPDHTEALINLGNVMRQLGRHEDAIGFYRKTISCKPDYAVAHFNLGIALREQNKDAEAFESYRRAAALDPNNDFFWAGMAGSIAGLTFTGIDDKLAQDLMEMLESPSVSPSLTVRPIVSALWHQPAFSQAFRHLSSDPLSDAFDVNETATHLSSLPLFLKIMKVTPLYDIEIERGLTCLRQELVSSAIAGQIAEGALPFYVALALQCFGNEFVYFESKQETEIIQALEQKIEDRHNTNQMIDPVLAVALGSYRALNQYKWAPHLADIKGAACIRELIKCQIEEPQKEQALRPNIRQMSEITGAVSGLVRKQYEENPFPRWITIGLAAEPRKISHFLTGPPLRLNLGDYKNPENPDILIAGCGTGQQAISTARKYLNAQVLAIDLSNASLTYAMRKATELGVTNLQFAQADIMELGDLQQTFDLIECSGVLHHLEQPLEGWRILKERLRPGGLMRIGLYSELARQDVVAGRALIADKNYSGSAEGIRRCRGDVLEITAAGNQAMAQICRGNDFFTLSNFRDLLLHVEEHRFTIPQLSESLEALNLSFLGFEMTNSATLKKFHTLHTEQNAHHFLSNWHKFEKLNPLTFRDMYQFWCRKTKNS